MSSRERIRQLAEALKRAERQAEEQPWSPYRQQRARTLRWDLAREKREAAERAGQVVLPWGGNDNEREPSGSTEPS